jgi:hypothetical protein
VTARLSVYFGTGKIWACINIGLVAGATTNAQTIDFDTFVTTSTFHLYHVPCTDELRNRVQIMDMLETRVLYHEEGAIMIHHVDWKETLERRINQNHRV